MVIVCLAALAVVAIDAIRSRARLRLRTRTAQVVRPEIVSRGPEGSLDEIHRDFEASGEADSENPFARIGRSSSRPR